jgi:hypothetical protein
MKNAVFSGGMPMDFVRTDVSEERIASIIRVTRISELETTLVATSNRNTLHTIILRSLLLLLVTANAVPSSLILVTRMIA